MTPQQTKEAAQVMLAAEYDASGRCTNVEFQTIGGTYWTQLSTVSWNWGSCEYRIKPKPQLTKGQIIEVSDCGTRWKLRRFSQWADRGKVLAYDGIGRELHDCVFEMWRLPE